MKLRCVGWLGAVVVVALVVGAVVGAVRAGCAVADAEEAARAAEPEPSTTVSGPSAVDAGTTDPAEIR